MGVDGQIRTRARRVAVTLGVLAIAGLAVLFALPSPQARVYPDRIPVRFWHMWTSDWKVVIDRIVARFNASQDVYEVIPLSIPQQGADSKFLLAVAGGDPPDVMAQWQQVVPAWAENGLLLPVDELMTPAEREAFERDTYPVAKRIGQYKDRLYGIAIGLNIFACYYRADHFREAGVDPDRFPATLEALTEQGARLDRRDSAGNLVRVGFLPELYGNGLAMCAPAFGGGFYEWQRGAVTLDTPENLRALSYVVDCRRRLGFENVLRFTSGTKSGVGVDWPFVSGAYSVAVDGQWRVEELAKYAPQVEYRVAPFPAPSGGRARAGCASGNFMVIPRGARQAQGAWEFIKFWSGLSDPAQAAEFYVWGGWMPLSPAVAAAPAYREYVRKHPAFAVFLDLLASEEMQPAPPVPYQVYLSDAITRTEDFAKRGTRTPADALAWLKGEVSRELARRKEFGYAE